MDNTDYGIIIGGLLVMGPPVVWAVLDYFSDIKNTKKDKK